MSINYNRDKDFTTTIEIRIEFMLIDVYMHSKIRRLFVGNNLCDSMLLFGLNLKLVKKPFLVWRLIRISFENVQLVAKTRHFVDVEKQTAFIEPWVNSLIICVNSLQLFISSPCVECNISDICRR